MTQSPSSTQQIDIRPAGSTPRRLTKLQPTIIKMYLLSFLVLSLATVLLPAEAIPTQLHPRSQPYYCTPSTRFTLGYQICTFASLIDPSFKTYLWLFDSQCGIVGSATDITPSSLPASAGSGSHVYNFNSHLRYVAVTDLKDGQSPVVMKYAGKTWGGKKEQCWRDENQVSCLFAVRRSWGSAPHIFKPGQREYKTPQC